MAANDVTGTLPPFPEDVPTHPLLVIDYERLKAGDQAEQVRINAVLDNNAVDLMRHQSSIEHFMESVHNLRFLLVRILYHVITFFLV